MMLVCVLQLSFQDEFCGPQRQHTGGGCSVVENKCHLVFPCCDDAFSSDVIEQ